MLLNSFCLNSRMRSKWAYLWRQEHGKSFNFRNKLYLWPPKPPNLSIKINPKLSIARAKEESEREERTKSRESSEWMGLCYKVHFLTYKTKYASLDYTGRQQVSKEWITLQGTFTHHQQSLLFSSEVMMTIGKSQVYLITGNVGI